MSYSFGVEKGFVARPPSTAQLMVDSADRPNPTSSTPFNFQITRSQSILNGFFTRVSTTEVVLEWCEPNIDGSLIFDISGASSRQNVNIFGTTVGNFTMESLMDTVVAEYNALPTGTTTTTRPVGTTLSIIKTGGYYAFDISGGQGRVVSTPLAIQMGLDLDTSLNPQILINGCVDLRTYRYIDIVCSQLTYPQSLKDATTQSVSRDVLCRWYFAEDSAENVDGYGFPILQGYLPFVRRRIFNPPKYVKWDNNLPVGNLVFQVFDENGDLIISGGSSSDSNYLLTLQLQES